MKKTKKKGKSYSQGWVWASVKAFHVSAFVQQYVEHKRGKYSRICSCTSEGGDERQEFHWKKKSSGRQSGMLLKKERQ